jgi:hypothetical protein
MRDRRHPTPARGSSPVLAPVEALCRGLSATLRPFGGSAPQKARFLRPFFRAQTHPLARGRGASREWPARGRFRHHTRRGQRQIAARDNAPRACAGALMLGQRSETRMDRSSRCPSSDLGFGRPEIASRPCCQAS